MIKLLAVDLDDTLLTHDLRISSANKKAISRARQSGVEVVLASGRTLFSMEPYARELSMFGRPGFMIASNGSEVFDTEHGEPVFRKAVDAGAAARVYEIVAAFGLTMQYYGHGIIYSSGASPYTDLDCSLTGQALEIDADFERHLSGRTKFVIPGEPELMVKVHTALKAAVGETCTMFTSKPYFLEVLPGGADKGTALAHIARLAGLSSREVMAIGDSMNDYGMIQWAGLGIAMNNGREELRSAADAVTPLTNEEDGVAWAVEEYILKKPGVT
ncbi:MAG: HAD family phosphatase [Spirochaetales bacterium]|nr:HAD family phosphatase [Spirochaetales bacterium]